MNVLHVDSNHPSLIKKLAAAGYNNIEGYTLTREAVLRNQHLYDGIVIRSRCDIAREFIEQAPNLKFVRRVGAGLENINTACSQERGVVPSTAAELTMTALGEHALGRLLSLFINLTRADRQRREGTWCRE